MTRSILLAIWLAALICVQPARAGDFALKNGETVVFFGDSITQGGQYVNYVDAYLLTRFPDKTFRLINHGISSETISGTSESDHEPRRPWALPRFERDITVWKPDVVVACFGMNDGNYHPFEPVRFQKYQEGVETLIERTRDEAKARLVLMTPPPFDPYRRTASDPNATEYGYKFAAIDYDETLGRYSEWLLSLRDRGLTVVDQHGTANEHLRKRREKRVSFFLAGDAVHPNATGHWLMAQNLLLAWNAPAVAAEVSIDAPTGKATGGQVEDLTSSNRGVSLVWTAPLPMPHDPDWDADSIALERVGERLNRYRLAVTGLPTGRFGVSVNGEEVADYASEDLAAGVDLLDAKNFPPNLAAAELLQLVKKRNGLAYRIWRTEIGRPLGKPLDGAERENAERELAKFSQAIETLRQPKPLKIAIQPVSTK